MAESLIREEWTADAMHLVESAKNDCKGIDELFTNEMQILTHDRRMNRKQRHLRFNSLVDKVMNEKSAGKIKMKGLFEGTDLVWARARFQHDSV